MDAIGQEITIGDFIVYTQPKTIGYRASVVKQVKERTVNLVKGKGFYSPTKKDNDNVIVISEEQLLSMLRGSIHTNDDGLFYEYRYVRDENGNFVYGENGRYVGEEVLMTVEERLSELSRPYIIISRILKGEELEEYEPTPEEVEKFKL